MSWVRWTFIYQKTNIVILFVFFIQNLNAMMIIIPYAHIRLYITNSISE